MSRAHFAVTQRQAVLDKLAQDTHVSGFALCDALTYATDTLVLDAMSEALAHAPLSVDQERDRPASWALVALGGYGRRQMCLRSDIDIQLLVPDGAADPTPFMRRFLDALTRSGLRVGHGVRTVSEAVMLSQQDSTFATAALTSRHLAGDPTVTETVRASVYHHMTGPGLAALLEFVKVERQRRAERLGDTVYVLEPDLKFGVGGLRDAQLLGWLALITGRMFDREVLFAEDQLLRIRTTLHAHASFKCDRLAFEYQDQVAATLAIRDAHDDPNAEALMRRVHLAMRVISRRTRRQVELANDKLRAPVRARLDHPAGFVRIGDRLARADGAQPRTPTDVVDAVRAVVATGLPLEANLEDGMEALSAHLDPALTDAPSLNQLVVELVVDTSTGASQALHALHRTGLLAMILPEFEPVLGLVQRDLYHVYTVDEHILRAVDKVKALTRGELQATYPLATGLLQDAAFPHRALAIATLLHDIGKGYGPGHHARGAELAATICSRLGLDAEETALVVLLVRHQADMAMVCIRRDLSDPRPIRYIARLCNDRPTLAALYVLTLADWSSVGPGAFTSWHQRLLDALYHRVEASLRSSDIFADPGRLAATARDALLEAALGAVPQAPGASTEPIDDFVQGLPTRYFQSVAPERVHRHYQLWRRACEGGGTVIEVAPTHTSTHTEISVVCSDRPGLLARLTGGLAAARISVLSAAIHSLGDDHVLDIFSVADPHGRLAEPRHAKRLARALETAIGADEVLRPSTLERPWEAAGTGLPPIPASATVSNDAASEHTVIDVSCGDRPGLLAEIAHFFYEESVSVDLAFASTEGRVARDSFYVVDSHGQKLSPEHCERLSKALRQRIQGQ